MTNLKSNLVWIAPTCAIFISAFGLVYSGYLDPAPAPTNETQAAATPAPSSAVALEQMATAAVQATPEPTEESLNIVNAIKTAKLAATSADVVEADVTKNEPLEVLGDVTSLSEPAVVEAEGISHDFFTNAQENLVAENRCGDDLKSLAATSKIYFPAGGLTAEDSGLIKARVLARIAQDCPGYIVQVQGHSDPSGSSAINLKLSQKRAEAVVALLASGGINTSKFVAVGYGDQRPSGVAGPQGSAYYDRRVEFEILKGVQTASVGGVVKPWKSTQTGCVAQLQEVADQSRLFYNPRAITVSANELTGVYELARAVGQCDGARLRVVGHHSDNLSDREEFETGRLRALVMMGSLVAAGFDGQSILVGAPSRSMEVAGQPGLPKNRVEFQIIAD